MTRLRVGAVSYLNTKPLIRHLVELAPEIDLVLEVPSRLAVDLAEGRLDIGLIPSVEYFRGNNYTIIPGVSISSYGPVMSVKLCSTRPFGEIRSVAVDEGSRTSIALMQILLKQLFRLAPTLTPLALAGDCHSTAADACLVIGDRAMRIADGDYPFTLDLGYEWSRWTGLPFVFAFWSVAPGVAVPPRIQAAFAEAKNLGRKEIPAIAQFEAARLGIDAVRCHYYLESVIRHEFGEQERAGLERFYMGCKELGLVPEGRGCVFHG